MLPPSTLRANTVPHGGNMNRVVGGVCLLSVLAFASAAAPLFANSSSKLPKRTYVAPRYDTAREVTLEGTIESIVKRPSAGMMPGMHLLVATKQGTVDAQIGNWVFAGPHPAALSAGDSITLVGMLSTFNGRSVLLARLIETGSHTITVRNERGFVLPPGTALRTAHPLAFGGAR
jgi:hypothetical protein